MEQRRVLLHAGCGGAPLPPFLQHLDEVRLDIDPAQQPDIVADMADIPDIGPFDSVFTCHALEHLMPHDVESCLAGFFKVLKSGGTVVIFVPDLEGVAPTKDVLFVSPAGPITGHDLFYGHAPALVDRPYMAHRCGFVKESLKAALEAAGFVEVVTSRVTDPAPHNLFGFGVKP